MAARSPLSIRLRRWAALLACTVVANVALAQSPSEAWRTVHTDHFRIHYPVAAEPWALEIASRIEAMRSEVIAEVGWAMPNVVDVVVRDPVSMANGMALPFHRRPKMELWASPPGADSAQADQFPSNSSCLAGKLCSDAPSPLF